MAALSADRDTKQLAGPVRLNNFPVAAATTIYVGSITALDAAGNLVPASSTVALIVQGIAQETVDNSAGAAGALTCNVKEGVVARVVNGDTIVDAQRGDLCYAGDDQTVYKADITGTRPPAGFIMDVDSTGVWVLFGPQFTRGKLRKASIQVNVAALTAAAVTQTFDISVVLPTVAITIAHEIDITTLISGGSISACVADVGHNGNTDAIVDGHDVFTGAATGKLTGSTLGVHYMGDHGGQKYQVVITATGDDLDNATAGDVTFSVWYYVPEGAN